MTTAPLLRMTDISKRFGATRALDGVSLEVRPGEVLALLGENGAGKSTLMKILSGAQPPDAGTMELDGAPYQPRRPADARQAGVAMIYQELNLAPHLSVEDNIMLGQEVSRAGWLLRRQQRPRVREVLKLLGNPDLHPGTPVQELSVAAQQLVEIARALVMEARVIVFDEPTSSLTRKDVERLFHVIRRLRERGIGIVYISHFLEEVRQICDRYSVLRDGRSVGSGSLAGASEDQIVSLMVGRSVEELFPQVPHTPGEVLLKVTGLSGLHTPQDMSLEVRAGEILGITGLVGAGRTEFLRCLFGLDAVRSGQVTLADLRLPRTARGAIEAGLGYVSEDRKGEGLAQQQSIADNLTLSRLEPYSRWGLLNLRRRRAAARHWMRTLQVKARDPEQQLTQLSGGNQQKVALARILHQQAQVLLLDEPTRGIDVGTKAEIYRLMGEAAAGGKAIIFVSSYFTELLAVCDRIAVMSRGRLRRVLPARDWTEHSILQAAMGLEETTT
ncbi:MAG TPA: sugar ABC transporter [Planctomycetaceae bacterium]|jgi:ribose transport system ATP-binding protein|nr:sugar ABC transporter [Planctomycetaceae bacterium]